jgi:16S rRNA (cytosine967-C5)-methyltransferase
MSVSPARMAAFDVLLKIFRDGAYSSILLPAAESNLNEKDRSLCHEIVLGVLRTKLKLDAAIDRFAGGKALDLEVRTAAELGLYQLLHLEKIPKYSAVNESVALVQRAKKSSAKGFVNALLRRSERLFEEISYADELERLSVETSHPRWLVEKWVGQRGFEPAKALIKANNLRPRSAFRITPKGIREGVVPSAGWQRSKYVPGCYFAERMTPGLRDLAENGRIYFQDEGSQLVGSLVNLEPGSKFLDVSAAPGSKTTMIASGAPSDTLIVAGDVRQSRVRVLKRNCEAQGISNVRIVRYDAVAALPFADGEFDSVLLDAPCSGTGTIRSNPEIRYFLKPGDLRELHDKQLAILRNASKTVRHGGRLIYSTCSLEGEENEGVIVEFLSGNADFEIRRPEIAGELVTDNGFVRTLPEEHEMDGFFAAVLERRA